MPDRAALVTGASSGIGLAIARALGEDGYGVTMSARRPDKLEQAAAGLRDAGLEVEAVPANMSEEDDIKALVERQRERFGRLDVLVNNAGVGVGGAIADAETKKLDMQLDVNLRAVYLTSREAIPMLKEAGAEHGKALIVEHGVDRREVRPGVARGLLRDEVRGRRASPRRSTRSSAPTASRPRLSAPGSSRPR